MIDKMFDMISLTCFFISSDMFRDYIVNTVTY
jgi:hypothetical protein